MGSVSSFSNLSFNLSSDVTEYVVVSKRMKFPISLSTSLSIPLTEEYERRGGPPK